MPASTVRAWILGLIWAVLLSGMNQFFFFRYPSVVIGGVSFDLCRDASWSTNLYHYMNTACRPTPRVPNRSCVGSNMPALVNIWFRLKPGPLYYQGTREFIFCMRSAPLKCWNFPNMPCNQVLVTIMASVGAQSAYATDIIAVQHVYYKQAWSFLCKSLQHQFPLRMRKLINDR